MSRASRWRFPGRNSLKCVDLQGHAAIGVGPRRVLIVREVALSLVVLMGAGVMVGRVASNSPETFRFATALLAADGKACEG